MVALCDACYALYAKGPSTALSVSTTNLCRRTIFPASIYIPKSNHPPLLEDTRKKFARRTHRAQHKHRSYQAQLLDCPWNMMRRVFCLSVFLFGWGEVCCEASWYLHYTSKLSMLSTYNVLDTGKCRFGYKFGLLISSFPTAKPSPNFQIRIGQKLLRPWTLVRSPSAPLPAHFDLALNFFGKFPKLSIVCSLCMNMFSSHAHTLEDSISHTSYNWRGQEFIAAGGAAGTTSRATTRKET